MHESLLLGWLNFIVLSLTLVCVGWYLIETHRIRIAGEKQLEAQIAPALTAVVEGDSTYVSNVGSGVALKVRAKRSKSESVDWRAVPNLAPWLKGVPVVAGQKVDTGELVSSVGTLRGECLQLFYKSLSGKTYCSVVTFSGDGTPEDVSFSVRRDLARSAG